MALTGKSGLHPPPGPNGSRGGDAAFAQGRWGEAARLYTADANARLSRAAASRLASALARGGDIAKASGVLDTYLAQYPGDAPALRLAGDLAAAAGAWPRAVSAYARAQSVTGDRDAQLDASLGVALARSGRRTEGVVQLRRAVALAPREPAFRAALAEVARAR